MLAHNQKQGKGERNRQIVAYAKENIHVPYWRIAEVFQLSPSHVTRICESGGVQRNRLRVRQQGAA